MNLIKDTTNRDLGLRRHKCRICGCEGLFQSYLVREMKTSACDEFEYFVCAECYTLQIGEIPDNLGKYYSGEYYSFEFRQDQDVEFETPVTCTDKLLDVGCGTGKWLFDTANKGYSDLYGCDPFLEHEIHYGNRVHIKNCSIHDMDGEETFDAIFMKDSLEHMSDPKEALDSAYRLLKSHGHLLITLPIFPNIGFDMFGPHWYQLDAPIHIFIPSMKSLKYLSDQCGFSIGSYKYNSNNTAVVFSFFFQNGIPETKFSNELVAEFFTNDDLAKIKAMITDANASHRGDHIEVYLEKVD